MGSLLDKVRRIPAEKFRLPTNGFQYPDDMFVNVEIGEIEVFPISSYDEILLKTPEMLLSGQGIFEVIGRKVPCIKHPSLLASKDVDFILTCLRKVTYGDSVTLEYTHTCDDAKKHSYTIALSEYINRTKHLDPIQCDNLFSFSMPNEQQVVLNNIKFSDVIKLTQTSMQMENNENLNFKDVENSVIETLCTMIKNVDGVDDEQEISEWLREIPAPYVAIIQEHIQKTSSNWGIDFATTVKCKDCGGDIDLSPSINPVSFFIQL